MKHLAQLALVFFQSWWWELTGRCRAEERCWTVVLGRLESPLIARYPTNHSVDRGKLGGLFGSECCWLETPILSISWSVDQPKDLMLRLEQRRRREMRYFDGIPDYDVLITWSDECGGGHKSKSGGPESTLKWSELEGFRNFFDRHLPATLIRPYADSIHHPDILRCWNWSVQRIQITRLLSVPVLPCMSFIQCRVKHPCLNKRPCYHISATINSLYIRKPFVILAVMSSIFQTRNAQRFSLLLVIQYHLYLNDLVSKRIIVVKNCMM